MANGFVDIKEFMQSLDDFDKEFLNFSMNIDSLSFDMKNTLEKMSDESEDYKNNFIRKTVETFSDYLSNLENLKSNLENTKINLSKTEHKIFSQNDNIDYTISICKENSAKILNLIKALNDYSFKQSDFKYAFDGESVEINGNAYSVPDYPKVSKEDFNTDKGYMGNVIELYSLCLSQIDCVNSIISFYSSSNFVKIVDTKRAIVEKNFEEKLESDFNEKMETSISSFKEFYSSRYSQFIKDNNALLHDYMTIKNFEMPSDFTRFVNIGSLVCSLQNFDKYNEKIFDLDDKKLIKKTIRFPYAIDLSKKGSILINFDSNDSNVVNFVHQLILQYISSAPFKKMNLALIDLDNSSEFDFVFNYSKEYLKKNGLIVGGNVVTEDEDFKDIVTTLNKKINEIKGEKLGPKNCNNIFEYNKLSKENTQEMYVMVYVNCPKCLDSSLAEKITSLVKNGNKCGVYSIILNNTNYKLSEDSYSYNFGMHEAFIDKISANSIVVDYDSRTLSFKIEGYKFTPNHSFGVNDINQFFKNINTACDSAKNTRIIYLDSIINQKYSKKNYFEQIKLPIGKDGGEPIFFELDVGGTGTSSAIIVGGTGSGKSSLLHTIILSGAYNYSPDELEYYLIDFKDGAEFSHYESKEYGVNIPHVSFLSLKNKVEDAYDILMKVYKEKEYRNECFKKAHVSDIKAYQSLPDVISHKLPSFKRTIVIIDEYQNFLQSTDTNKTILCNKCAGILLQLLKEIRSVGISLVLASQTVALEREALDQIYNRYVLSSSTSDIQNAFPEFSGDSMNVELNKEKGLVYKTNDGGKSNRTLFKAAWCGETNGAQHKNIASLINLKWPNYSKDLIVSGSQSPLMFADSLETFMNLDNFPLNEDDQINSLIGRSALSNDLVSLTFKDSDFCNYLIVGEIKIARHIETSIGLSFLCSLKKNGFALSERNVIYLDLSNGKDAIRNPSSFDVYRNDLAKLINYSVEETDIVSSINDIYEEYLNRKEASRTRSRDIKTPKLVIVNSFSCLDDLKETKPKDNDLFDIDAELASLSEGFSSSSIEEISLKDKIIELYTNGFTYGIYVVIQERRASILNKNERFADFSKVICADANEIENCLTSINGGNITLTDLPANYAILFPDVSKIRPFEFDKSEMERTAIKKLVEALEGE